MEKDLITAFKKSQSGELTQDEILDLIEKSAQEGEWYIVYKTIGSQLLTDETITELLKILNKYNRIDNTLPYVFRYQTMSKRVIDSLRSKFSIKEVDLGNQFRRELYESNPYFADVVNHNKSILGLGKFPQYENYWEAYVKLPEKDEVSIIEMVCSEKAATSSTIIEADTLAGKIPNLTFAMDCSELSPRTTFGRCIKFRISYLSNQEKIYPGTVIERVNEEYFNGKRTNRKNTTV